VCLWRLYVCLYMCVLGMVCEYGVGVVCMCGVCVWCMCNWNSITSISFVRSDAF